MKKITLLFILLTTSLLSAQNFTNVSNSLAQLQNSITCWIDINNDGVQELYLTGLVTSSVTGGGLYSYETGSFTLLTNTGLPTLDNGAAKAGDFNNDGYLDLFILGYDENNSVAITDIYLNNGDNTFSAMNLSLPLCYLGDVQMVDINNDGLLDIAFTGMETTGYSNISKIYKNTSSGTIVELTATPIIGMMMGKIRFADYDADGFQDFVLNGWDSNTNTPYTKIWHNNGNETFTETADVLPTLWLGDMEWGDYDNDGDQDLIISGTSSSDSEVHLYQNNAGTFTEITGTGLPNVHLSALEWADFNNDGIIDLYLTGNEYVTTPATNRYRGAIFINDGTGVFTENTNVYITPITYGDAAASDFDGDGYTDLIVSGVNDIGNPFSVCYKNAAAGSVNDAEMIKVLVYPNPISDRFTIYSDNNYTCKIYSITGNLVFEQTDFKAGALQIDASKWARGIYLLEIQSDIKKITKKLIIK